MALRIGTVKNSKNFLRVVGLARVMSAGVEKEGRGMRQVVVERNGVPSVEDRPRSQA